MLLMVITWNMKVKEIKTKIYHLKNIFIWSDHEWQRQRTHTKSNNLEVMVDSKTDEIIEEHFKSLLQRYQEGWEESMKESGFIFDSVDLLCYHLQKANLKRTGSSYINSLKWLKNKKATINPKITMISFFSML